MKVTRFTILIIAFLIAAISLVSCSDDNNSNSITVIGTDKYGNIITDHLHDTEVDPNETKVSFETRKEYGYIEGQVFLGGYIAYGDYIFDANSTDGDIVYKNLKNLSIDSISVFTDPLSDEYGVSALGISGSVSFMLIDEYETERNGGVPVFVLLITSWREKNGIWEPYSIIVKYNMKTRKSDLISNDIPSDVENFGLYDEYFYIGYNNGDYGSEIWRIDFDGNILKKDNPDKKQEHVEAINSEYIYIVRSYDGVGYIYRYTHDFKNEKFICESVPSTQVYCYKDSVYFYDDSYNIATVDGVYSVHVSLLKASDDGEGKTEEYLEHAINVFEKNGVLYYIGYGPRFYGSYGDKSNNIIYARDLENDKEWIVADFSDRTNDFVLVRGIYGNCMTLEIRTYSDDPSIAWPIMYKYCHYNLETGALSEVFFVDVDPVTGTFTFR